MFKRPTIPLLIVFLVGTAAFAQYYISDTYSQPFQNEMTSWFRIIGGFALILGAYSLLHMHIARMRRRAPGWAYSAFVFIGFISMFAAGLWNSGHGPFQKVASSKALFDWGYDYIQIPAQATIFSILAFYMASSAFRTFRAKSLGATFLLITALIVMIGLIPFGEILGQWIFGNRQAFADATKLIMEYPNTAAQRGILLGVSLGAISQSVRILMGIERSYLGGGGKK